MEKLSPSEQETLTILKKSAYNSFKSGKYVNQSIQILESFFSEKLTEQKLEFIFKFLSEKFTNHSLKDGTLELVKVTLERFSDYLKRQ